MDIPALQVVTHNAFLLADGPRFSVYSLQNDAHHLHLAFAKGLKLHCVFGEAAQVLPLASMLMGSLEAMDDFLAVRVLLLMELSLHLLGVKVLKQVGLEFEGGKGLKVMVGLINALII